MNLQRMKFLVDGKIKKHICGVNDVFHGGEFTFCGCAIPDSNLNYLNFEADGNEYKGSVKDITCPACKGFIKYVKALK
jgi:hypothetical protein